MSYKTGWTLKDIHTGELTGFSPDAPQEWNGGEIPVPVIMVEIPEAFEDNFCNSQCPLFSYEQADLDGLGGGTNCGLKLAESRTYHIKPGPSCPAGKKP